MRGLLFVSALLLGAGCTYDFNVATKGQCPLEGTCAAGSKCLGGQCIAASRVSCILGDRHCVEGVAWTCAGDVGETGEDCAAKSLTCVAGSCRPPCDASHGCSGEGQSCDLLTSTCVGTSNCTLGGKECQPGSTCRPVPWAKAPNTVGICVAEPPESTPRQLLCYAREVAQTSRKFPGLTKSLVNEAVESVPFTVLSQKAEKTDRSAPTGANTGEFNLALEPPWSPLRLAVLAEGATLASVQFGPTLQGATGERVELITFQGDKLDALIGPEISGRNAGKFDFPDRGLLVGQVIDCEGRKLANATVGYSVPPARAGYFSDKLIGRGGASSNRTGDSGAFVAYDLPVDVDFAVVVTAKDPQGALYTLSAQIVRIPRPAAGKYAPVSVIAGRGATSN